MSLTCVFVCRIKANGERKPERVNTRRYRNGSVNKGKQKNGPDDVETDGTELHETALETRGKRQLNKAYSESTDARLFKRRECSLFNLHRFLRLYH